MRSPGLSFLEDTFLRFAGGVRPTDAALLRRNVFKGINRGSARVRGTVIRPSRQLLPHFSESGDGRVRTENVPCAEGLFTEANSGSAAGHLARRIAFLCHLTMNGEFPVCFLFASRAGECSREIVMRAGIPRLQLDRGLQRWNGVRESPG